MRSLKRIFAISMTSLILLSTTIVANAETSQVTDSKNSVLMNQKESLREELQNIQNDLQTIENDLDKNKEELASIEQKVSETKELIEKKKEEIVVLEDKVQTRKGIMEERLVSLQHNNQAKMIIEVIVNADSLSDLLERATAASTILNADKDLLEQQKQDLKQIERDKEEINKQEEILSNQYKTIEANQVQLKQSLKNKQEVLSTAQEKYNSVVNKIELAADEKSSIEQTFTRVQNNINNEKQNSSPNTNNIPIKESSAGKGKVLYVTATAYSHEDTTLDITATGYNIKKNRNMKLIAVDPSIIPLGSKVWVEGYGNAIAGDTGGAIKGHKIDVLMPSGAAARSWGRKTVKIKVLN